MHLENRTLPPKVQKCRRCDDGCLCLNSRYQRCYHCPIVAEYHRRGIAHLGCCQIFILVKSKMVTPEAMAKGIARNVQSQTTVIPAPESMFSKQVRLRRPTMRGSESSEGWKSAKPRGSERWKKRTRGLSVWWLTRPCRFTSSKRSMQESCYCPSGSWFDVQFGCSSLPTAYHDLSFC